MSGQASGSGSGQGSALSTPTKAITSLARKSSDVTRQGTQKLKFTPTLPRKGKQGEVKTEPAASPVTPAGPSTPTPTRGGGRGDGRGRGTPRGRGRGGPPPQEMSASGPFAMGPALMGSSGSRRPAASTATAIPTTSKVSLGSTLSNTAPAQIKKEDGAKGKQKAKAEVIEEVYSEPDEGVEIIDLENIRRMDWNAPESLKKERVRQKLKIEGQDIADAGDVNLSNAIDVEESEEEEEELEDMIEDFNVRSSPEEDDMSLRQDRLFFFQFPAPFPLFDPLPTQPSSPPKRVTFADDADVEMEDKSATPQPSASAVKLAPSLQKGKEKEKPKEEDQPADGVIGQLEVYRSGTVKMRLENGILLDVKAATQPSFLQYAASVDMHDHSLTILGEVNKRFVVSPDIDALLSAMEVAEANARTLDTEGLIKMDTL